MRSGTLASPMKEVDVPSKWAKGQEDECVFEPELASVMSYTRFIKSLGSSHGICARIPIHV